MIWAPYFKMKRVKIADLCIHLPKNRVGNEEIEARVNSRSKLLPEGGLERLFGIRERRFAAKNEQVSDLATQAAKPIVERLGASKIEFLIFASACQDLIEPATANIVQHKLGLHCPAMDVKNACNSFVSGMMTASSLIAAGICSNMLIVSGEKPSDAIRFDFDHAAQLSPYLAGFTFGDAGAAVLLTGSDDNSGFHFQRLMTKGEHWELCTVKGGGSLFPHDAEQNYFEGRMVELKEVLATEARQFFKTCLQEANWQPGEIQHLFTHQVSTSSLNTIAELTGVPSSRIEPVFQHFGNTVSASIPLAMYLRLQRGEIKRGDKIALLGLAAGVSVTVQLMVW